MDLIAERIRVSGHPAPGSYAQFAKLSSPPDAGPRAQGDQDDRAVGLGGARGAGSYRARHVPGGRQGGRRAERRPAHQRLTVMSRRLGCSEACWKSERSARRGAGAPRWPPAPNPMDGQGGMRPAVGVVPRESSEGLRYEELMATAGAPLLIGFGAAFSLVSLLFLWHEPSTFGVVAGLFFVAGLGLAGWAWCLASSCISTGRGGRSFAAGDGPPRSWNSSR